jgi:hypothetical protein
MPANGKAIVKPNVLMPEADYKKLVVKLGELQSRARVLTLKIMDVEDTEVIKTRVQLLTDRARVSVWTTDGSMGTVESYSVPVSLLLARRTPSAPAIEKLREEHRQAIGRVKNLQDALKDARKREADVQEMRRLATSYPKEFATIAGDLK